MNNGDFVSKEQYNPPFITEDMNVTLTMLKHGILPDMGDLDDLAESLAEALKTHPKGHINEPLRKLQEIP